ncbi:MAG: hypothetical protein H6978_10210 [Gammaproteobacteria bacterium]|nr:hypothetical protein [Gammaproteobacteria bacterium]
MNRLIRPIAYAALSILAVSSALAAQDEGAPLDEAPVRIEPDKRGTVESYRLANGKIRYKVTPRNGKPHCWILEERDPFDPFTPGANFRVPCD